MKNGIRQGLYFPGHITAGGLVENRGAGRGAAQLDHSQGDPDIKDRQVIAGKHTGGFLPDPGTLDGSGNDECGLERTVRQFPALFHQIHIGPMSPRRRMAMAVPVSGSGLRL